MTIYLKKIFNYFIDTASNFINIVGINNFNLGKEIYIFNKKGKRRLFNWFLAYNS